MTCEEVAQLLRVKKETIYSWLSYAQNHRRYKGNRTTRFDGKVTNATTQRYAHPVPERKATAIEILNSYLT